MVLVPDQGVHLTVGTHRTGRLVLTPAWYNEADTASDGVIVNPSEMQTLQHDHDDHVDIVNGLPLIYTALSILRHSYQSN
jgi:hypothetical protein